MTPLLLWNCILFVIIGCVRSATISRTDNLKLAVDNVQKKFTNKAEHNSGDKSSVDNLPENDLKVDESIRHHKMLDYFGYLPQPMMQPYPTAFYPQSFYEDYNNIDEDDLMSRANRRKPSSNQQNSPIFYIRLPPTPYMFVPGMGYISQPPRIQPIAAQFPIAPQLQSVPMNPFLNVPVNFISNGKPNSVYQWGGSNTGSDTISGGSQTGLNGGFGPQYPSYLPSRPQRPSYRPSKPYLQDSKITHLKGPYVFNGRPEDIFVLPNSPYNVPFNPQYNTAYGNSAAPVYSNPGYNNMGYSTPYNAAYSSIYSDQLQNFY